jgi:hypothetical protein
MNCGLRIADCGLKKAGFVRREVLECARLAAALDWAPGFSTTRQSVFGRSMESGGKPPHSKTLARRSRRWGLFSQSLVTSTSTRIGGVK